MAVGAILVRCRCLDGVNRSYRDSNPLDFTAKALLGPQAS